MVEKSVSSMWEAMGWKSQKKKKKKEKKKYKQEDN